MLKPPSKTEFEELPDPIRAPSNSSHHHSFPPLQSQSTIGRSYQLGPISKKRGVILDRIKRMMSSWVQR